MMKSLIDWYYKNIGKVLLLSIVLIVFTVTTRAIPYISFIIPGEIGLPIVFTGWCLIFSISTKKLIYASFVFMILGFVCKLFQLNMVAVYFGNFLFLELILIFINMIKDTFKNKQNII